MNEFGLAHKLEGQQRTADVRLKEMAPFAKMLLSSPVRKGLQQAGFVYPTVIQATAIPVGKSGLDLLVQSKSGTGKTLIFSTILLEAYDASVPEPQALILAPTREIAVQIETVLNQIGRFCAGFRAVFVIGGLDVAEDRKRLQGAKAVVATPGRLLHVIQNEVLNTEQIKLLVLDEADKLYTSSFRQDLKRILKALPAQRQTLACSATFCGDLDKELAKCMRNPLLISTEERATLLVGIKQFVYELPEQKTSILEMQSKLDALRDIFGRIPFKQCLIFAGSQSRADSYRNYLEKDGWPCDLISGAQDQRMRLEMFHKFREFKTRILFTTDLMSRGVDSEHVNLVINLELSADVVTYLHRIGRAGRFGSHGIAISFVASEKDRCTFKRLISEVGSGMSVLKFPKKNQLEETKCDFWNFNNISAECEQYGVFNQESLASLASQDQTGTHEDKENQTDNVCNSFFAIDTKTCQVDSKHSAVNVHEMQVDRCGDNAQSQLQEQLTSVSRQGSSQQLPSSNTIDDASSIAADSVRSSQQDISHAHSLVGFLVDQRLPEVAVGAIDAKQKQKSAVNFFDDYQESVLHCEKKPLDEHPAKTAEAQITTTKLLNFTSLLIDKPTDENNKKVTAKQQHLYTDYANYNENEDESSSISQPTTAEEVDQATCIISTATPSIASESQEEVHNSSLDLSQFGSTNDTLSPPEKQHFTSPVHNQQTLQGADVLSLPQPAYQSPSILAGAAANVAPLNGIDLLSSSGSEGSQDNQELDTASNTERGGGSSGFNENTTSASSGIETTDTAEEDDDEEDDIDVDEEYTDDEEDEEDEAYAYSEADSSGEVSEDESCDFEKTLNGEAGYVESDDGAADVEETETDTGAVGHQANLNDSAETQSEASNYNSLAYQSAYAQWVAAYKHQLNMLQQYMLLQKSMQRERHHQ